MTVIANGRVLFNEVPSGYPDPNKTVVYDESEKLDLDNTPLNGGVLVKTLYLSIDPYMRGRMREPDVESYAPPFLKGKPIDCHGVGVVVRSEDPSIKAGDHVYGMFPFSKYFVQQDAKSLKVLPNEAKLPWSTYVGVCGMPGQTAYCAWKEFAAAKKGETIWVTAGSGPVGATVIQLAKLDGLKVIASAGSDDKVDFMKSIGADVAFNYKKQDTREVLKKEGPIDLYWDNVGGEMLEIALDAAKPNARFLECGMISGYNTTPYAVKNLMNIVAKQIKMYGFLVFPLLPKYEDAFYKEVPHMVASGKIKYKEDRTYGLEKSGEAIVDVQKGTNKGKKVVVVAEE